MKNFLLISFFFVFTILGKAQYTETLHSDRPGFSNSAHTLGKKVFQAQLGYTFERINSEFQSAYFSSGSVGSNINTANLKLRLGIFEKLDISGRIIYNKRHSRMSRENEPDLENYDYFGGLAFGSRYKIYSSTNAIPSISAEIEFLDVAAKHYSTNLLINTMYESQICDRLSLTLNMGYYISKSGQLALNAAFKASEKLGVFVEYNCIQNLDSKISMEGINSSTIQSFTSGLTYLINQNLQLDFFGAYYILEEQNHHYYDKGRYSANAGLTWRCDWRD